MFNAISWNARYIVPAVAPRRISPRLIAARDGNSEYDAHDGPDSVLSLGRGPHMVQDLVPQPHQIRRRPARPPVDLALRREPLEKGTVDPMTGHPVEVAGDRVGIAGGEELGGLSVRGTGGDDESRDGIELVWGVFTHVGEEVEGRVAAFGEWFVYGWSISCTCKPMFATN